MQFDRNLLLIAPANISHSPAFDRAQALALAAEASLHVIAFVHAAEGVKILDLIDAQERHKAQEGYMQLYLEWLNEEASVMRKHGVEVTVEVVWTNHPHDRIAKYINSADISLVIKDVHRERGLKRVFFTPFDWRLLRDSAVPVHLVTGSPHALPRKILVSIDALHVEHQIQQQNEHLIEFATTLASVCNATLHLISIYDWSSLYLTDTGIENTPLLVSPSYDECKTYFDAVADKHAIAITRRHFLAGTPIKSISDFAGSNEFDVLVMGTYSRGALKKLLGSTAEQILYRPPCSILVVAPQ